jgi:hypothetical protein
MSLINAAFQDRDEQSTTTLRRGDSHRLGCARGRVRSAKLLAAPPKRRHRVLADIRTTMPGSRINHHRDLSGGGAECGPSCARSVGELPVGGAMRAHPT